MHRAAIDGDTPPLPQKRSFQQAVIASEQRAQDTSSVDNTEPRQPRRTSASGTERSGDVLVGIPLPVVRNNPVALQTAKRELQYTVGPAKGWRVCSQRPEADSMRQGQVASFDRTDNPDNAFSSDGLSRALLE